MHRDDWAVLVHYPVHATPATVDIHVGLVDEPAAVRCMPPRPGGADQQRGETLHPAVQGDVIDVSAAFGEELLEIPVGRTEPQLPAHRQENHFGQEPEVNDGRQIRRGWRYVTMPFHFDALAATIRSVNATAPPWATYPDLYAG